MDFFSCNFFCLYELEKTFNFTKCWKVFFVNAIRKISLSWIFLFSKVLDGCWWGKLNQWCNMSFELYLFFEVQLTCRTLQYFQIHESWYLLTIFPSWIHNIVLLHCGRKLEITFGGRGKKWLSRFDFWSSFKMS